MFSTIHSIFIIIAKIGDLSVKNASQSNFFTKIVNLISYKNS